MKSKNQKTVIVQEWVLQDAIALLERLKRETPRSAKRLKDVINMIEELKSALGDGHMVHRLFDMFKTIEGYRYVIDLLVKCKHIIEIDDNEYRESYARLENYGRTLYNGKLSDNDLKVMLAVFTPYAPPIKWIQDRQHFCATLEEIYNKGYLKGKPERKQMPDIARYFFQIDHISPSMINQSSLHENFIFFPFKHSDEL